MQNPWLEIPEEDYVAHMSDADVGQRQALGRIFQDALRSFAPCDLLVLGCSSGNGFQHIEPRVTRRVTGIDINPTYLELLASRFPSPSFELSLACADLADYSLPPHGFDLTHAPLIFEYLDWKRALPGVVRSLRTGGVLSVVLQRPSPSAPAVSRTKYPRLRKLERLFAFVGPDALRAQAAREGLTVDDEFSVPLKQEKAFHVFYFRKPPGAAPLATEVFPLVRAGTEVTIRGCRTDEAEAILLLWREAGATPSPTDTAEQVRRAIGASPAHVLVAEASGSVVGSIMGGFDGWRGNIYRLAVHPDYRRRGIARALVAEIEKRLAAQGATRIMALVEKDHDWAALWRAAGYATDSRMVRFVHNLEQPPASPAGGKE
jgi:GNAT superfamily N-acetyltransferase